MIRVLEVVASMNRGGVETTLMNILRTIDREKVIMDFLVTTDEECDYYDEIRELGGLIYSVPNRRKGVFKNKKALDDFFRVHNEYKIVHMHGASLSYIEPLIAAKKNGVPVRIIHSRNTRQNGSRVHVLLHFYHRLFIKNIATHFFACSKLAADWMYGNKIQLDRWTMINNGIITDKFVFNQNKRDEIRKELNINNDEYAIVNVGRLADQKNHLFLLKVFVGVLKRDSSAKLFLVGDGPNRVLIENFIRENGIEDSVSLLGVRSNIYDLLQGMDLFFMPSLYEGLPGSVIEAQGSSLPCILSDSITKEVAVTNLVEYLSLNDGIDMWVESILKKKNYKRRNTKDEIVNAGFDMNTIAMKLEEFYIEEGNKHANVQKKDRLS